MQADLKCILDLSKSALRIYFRDHKQPTSKSTLVSILQEPASESFANHPCPAPAASSHPHDLTAVQRDRKLQLLHSLTTPAHYHLINPRAVFFPRHRIVHASARLAHHCSKDGTDSPYHMSAVVSVAADCTDTNTRLCMPSAAERLAGPW